MAPTVTERLICPQCATVLGQTAYRRFAPTLVVTSIDDFEVYPEKAELLLLWAKADAAQAPDGPAHDRVDWLEKNDGELVFDLRCRQCASTPRRPVAPPNLELPRLRDPDAVTNEECAWPSEPSGARRRSTPTTGSRCSRRPASW